MLTSLLRTVILLLAVIFVLRLMGKRQIGQLQPSELVITILLSQIASTPMQDNDIPLLNTLLVMAVLAGFEILISVLSLKNKRLRQLLDGSPVLIIKDGQVLQPALKKLRYTMDDVLEALRDKDVFDISTVAFAVVETNGSISVLLKPGEQPLPYSYMEKEPPDEGVPYILISDGKLLKNGMKHAGIGLREVECILKKEKVRQRDVFLLTRNKKGKVFLIRKEETDA